MFVIGTAGHVDHGKSTLVTALTGIDPDRLSEEKERGMTIDLGFAWMTLPSGREVSLVDVPGHERFIKNMLAGVGGIDLALLVVAADEGPMPQTEEHLSILELLRVKRAVVTLTKIDLVDAEWLELVRDAVHERLAQSRLRGAPIIPVSAVTGEGIPDLLAALDATLDDTDTRDDVGRPRLPIDRVFTVAGFGTVVTGTLIGGRLQVGQELEVQPGGLKTRARGIQTHRKRVEEALPGTRVAVNLGGLPVDELRRGLVVTTPGWLHPTQAVDVRLDVLRQASRPLVHNARVTFHTGAAEAMARVILLEADEIAPGESGWAQLKLMNPVATVKGDLFVLRTPNETIGGGEIIDPYARRHRRRQATIIEALELRQRGSPEEIVFQTVNAHAFAEVADIARHTGLAASQVRDAIEANLRQGSLLQIGGSLVSVGGWQHLAQQVRAVLEGYHRQYPLRVGMPKEELKSRLGLPSRLFGMVLERLTEEGTVATTDLTVSAPDHAVRFTPEQERQVAQALAMLSRDGYSPPSLHELGLEPEVVSALVEQGKLVRVSEAIAFAPEIYEEMVARIRNHLETNGSISVAEVRDMFDTSRRYALALLEHLDERRITRRVGDVRTLR